MDSIKLNDVLFDKLNSYYKKYEARDIIWREECIFCYDSPKNSFDEYYICLSTYIGFCKKHIDLYLDDTMKFFVAIKRIPNDINPSSENIPKKLGIGVEEGFGNKKFKEDLYVTVSNKFNMQRLIYDPAVIPNDISALIHTIHFYSQSNQFIPWSDSEAPESVHSSSLVQISDPPIISNSGWKCSQCELKTNLWMNLTDGVINCGRRNFDGSGGNNHAYEHYVTTKHPLAVKLTSLDPTCVEVYSYTEDKMVKDTHIDLHLNHFGIDRRSFIKLEKTITEKEIDTNLNLKGEKDVILEHGVKLQQLFGPGYTGVVNKGNTCYMASILQVLFSFPEIIKQFSPFEFPQYFIANNISTAYISHLVDDIFYQMCKFCHYLHSEQYSMPVFNNDGMPTRQDDGILPIMLIHALIKDHVEFKTFRQQDVTEFFMYLCELLASRDEMVSKVNKDYKPASINHLFNFTIKEYFQLENSLADIHVRKSTEKILRLHIPEDQIDKINNVEGNNNQGFSLVQRNIFSWEKCLNYICSANLFDRMTINKKTGSALCYTRISSLPQYLIVQICKFSYNPVTFVPAKIDVLIPMPKLLDLSSYASIPDFKYPRVISSLKKPLDELDQFIIGQLLALNFPETLIRKAMIETNSAGVTEALDWILSHQDQTPVEEVNDISDTLINNLVSMGFPQNSSLKALKINNGNFERALEYLLVNIEHIEEDYAKFETPVPDLTLDLDPLTAKYELVSFISHIGSSSVTGHYVCHVHKDDQWVIYNDQQVAESIDPPFDRGYLYFYRRKDN